MIIFIRMMIISITMIVISTSYNFEHSLQLHVRHTLTNLLYARINRVGVVGTSEREKANVYPSSWRHAGSVKYRAKNGKQPLGHVEGREW